MPAASPMNFDSRAMFPSVLEFQETDLVETQTQLAHARRHIDHLDDRIAELESELKQAHQIFDEIHDHPIAGPIVRIRERLLTTLKIMKRNPQPNQPS